MNSKTDSNNVANAVTETLITRLEALSVCDPSCEGRCRICPQEVVDDAVKSLLTLHQERDWTVGKLELRINQLKARAEAAEAENRTLRDNEHLAIQRLSIMLTGGNAATWDEIFDSVAALTASPQRITKEKNEDVG